MLLQNLTKRPELKTIDFAKRDARATLNLHNANVAPNRGNARETVLCLFENARFFCVVLWAPDFETKEGIAVYHNPLSQLNVLLDGTKRLFAKVIETNGCPRHNPW